MVQGGCLGAQGLLGMDSFREWNLSISWEEGGAIVTSTSLPRAIASVHSPDYLRVWMEEFPLLFRFKPGAVPFPARIPTYAFDEGQVAFPIPRLSPLGRKREEQMVSNLLLQGLIEECPHSPFRARLHPVVKGMDEEGCEILRETCDLRLLNHVTIRDAMGLPNVVDLVLLLEGAEFISVLDMKSAFHQFVLAEGDRFKTAFWAGGKLYQWTVLPMGAKNSSAHLTRFLAAVFGEVDGVLSFADDIVVFTKEGGLEAHHQKLREVMGVLNEHQVSLSSSKCVFASEEVTLLGMKVRGDGFSFSDSHEQSLRGLSEVKDLKALRSALSFLAFLSPFVPSLSIKLAEFGGFRKRGASFLDWNSDYQGRWEEVINSISNKELVGFYDPSNQCPLSLAVDASERGWGGLVRQGDVVIGIANGSFYSSQLHNPDRELEAVYRSLVSLRYLLEGKQVIVSTDCKALTTLMGAPFSSPSLAKTQSKILDLGLELEVIHTPGTANMVADSLSRIGTMELVEMPDVQEVQQQDDQCQEWVKMVAGEVRIPPSLKATLKNMEVEEGVLLKNGIPVLPKEVVSMLVKRIHCEHGHLGVSRLLKLCRVRMWCEGLTKLVKRIVRGCLACTKGRPRARQDQASVGSWEVPTSSGQRTHLDHGFFEGVAFLIVVDSFSNFWEVELDVSLEATETLSHMLSWCSRWGMPDCVVTDNAGSFASPIFRGELEKRGVEVLTPPPFHPQGNGTAEGSVKALKGMVRRLRVAEKLTIKEAFSKAVMAHNLSPSSLHPFTPQQIQCNELEEEEVLKVWTRLREEREKGRRSGYAPSLAVGDRVVMASYLPNSLPFPFDGVVTGVEEDGGILVQSGDRVYRRSRDQLRLVEEEEEFEEEEDQLLAPVEDEELKLDDEEEEVKEQEEEEEMGGYFDASGNRRSLRLLNS